jgi:small subunit ribosomal protein S9
MTEQNDPTPNVNEPEAPAKPEADAPATEPLMASMTPAESDETPDTEPARRPRPVLTASRPWVWGTGRRKTAVARVRIKPGAGAFVVNKREAGQYFTEDRDRSDIVAPLKVTGSEGRFDVHVTVRGGGPTGQAGAIVLGLARALMTFDDALEPSLREHNLLTRDPRKVERKKYGQRGARRRFQFSKR